MYGGSRGRGKPQWPVGSSRGGNCIAPPPSLTVGNTPQVPPPPSSVGIPPANGAPMRNKLGYSIVERDRNVMTAMRGGSFDYGVKKQKDYFDEEDDVECQLPYQPAPDSPTHTGHAAGDSDEEDPLDAYMAEVDSQVKKQQEKSKDQSAIPARTDIEEEDAEESYYRYMEENPTAGLGPGEDLPDVEYDEEGNPIIEKKKHIDPLPPIDHSKVQYAPFERFFYNEHPEIAALSNKAAKDLRFKMGLNASGTYVPSPVCSFAHFGFDEQMMSVIRKAGYTTPTPIQSQAVPVALSGRDIIGIAMTGSGKTAAYLWPLLVHIMAQPKLKKGDGPIGLICAPTRELSLQIYSEAKKFGKVYGLRVVCAYGGGNKYEQCKALSEGAEIVVCTPGRMIDCIKAGATNFTRVTYLVFDEADRMFDLGFEPQVRSISNHVRPDRQALLFSATFQPRVERLAKDVLSNPVRVVQGAVGEANQDVTQHVLVLGSKVEKQAWLKAHLVSFLSVGQVLVFSTRKSEAEELAAFLKRSDFLCVLLHGDMHQFDRSEVITQFKQGHVKLMVATDVAARGLDIPAIRTVVNFDPARDMDTHVHRVGRTGRAGEKGDAYTLLIRGESLFASLLVQSLEAAHQQVPQDLIDLAMHSSRFRKMAEGGGWKPKTNFGLGYSDNSKQRPAPTAAAGECEPAKNIGPLAASRGAGGAMSGRLAAMKAQYAKNFTSNFRSASTEDAESTSNIHYDHNPANTATPQTSSSRWNKPPEPAAPAGSDDGVFKVPPPPPPSADSSSTPPGEAVPTKRRKTRWDNNG